MRPPLRQHALAVRGGGAEPDLHIAGKLFPALRKTVISGERPSEALAKVLDAAALADLAVIAALWLLADPLLRGWRRLHREARAAPWDRSFARLWARGLRRLAATMGALYVLDLGCLAAQTMGVPLGRDDVPLLAASFLYPVWFGRLASNIKRRALRVYPSREGPVAPNGDGKVLVYDRLCDVALAVFVAVVILELLSLELGVAFASLVAVSGASSVVVALACQEPLKHVINGLLLTFSDKFRPGDEISFGDVAGTVVNWGWFDTKIRQYNERTVVVPNGQIMNAKLINISRQRWGQYKTELRLRLEDGPIMDEVVAAIRAAVAPHVISRDRNVWVHWRRIDRDALVVVVDVKLPVPSGTTAYHELVERLNANIVRAIKEAEADLCLPTSRRI